MTVHLGQHVLVPLSGGEPGVVRHLCTDAGEVVTSLAAGAAGTVTVRMPGGELALRGPAVGIWLRQDPQYETLDRLLRAFEASCEAWGVAWLAADADEEEAEEALYALACQRGVAYNAYHAEAARLRALGATP